jgi:hypothetical protein
MTSTQRMTAYQLAAALRDALPAGTFDESDFLDRLHSELAAGTG